MKLRNSQLAVVDRRKVVGYLLNPAHPDNGGKTRFFETLGFSREDPESLIDALRSVASTGEAVRCVESIHGEKNLVDGLLSLHTGREPARIVRTVWIIERGQDAPRLVTAYPGKE